MLDQAQVERLLKPVNPKRVQQAQGHSHLPTFDVTAHLNRVFGFDGWDKEILTLHVVSERSTGVTDQSQGRWWVTYACSMRLTVRGPDGKVAAIREDAATGSSQNQASPGDAHDMAMKAAVSYALKRCAKDWGDQFGLSLYNGGSTAGLVGVTLVKHDHSIDAAAATALETQDHEYAPDDPERPYE